MVGAGLLALTALSFVSLGYELVSRRWGTRPRLEIWHAAFAVGALSWIATVWVAALVGYLDRPTMIGRTVAVAVAALLLFLLRRSAMQRPVSIASTRFLHSALPLLPVGIWTGVILWRSSIVPPLSHDALAYHLPRAVLWIRAQAFAYLDLPIDPRVRILPANYELLLADAILLAGGDALTEWIGTFFYVAFLFAAAALTARWWPRNRYAVTAVVLLTAAIPVVLLHTGADKNDLMTAFFMLSALCWAGSWFGERDLDALLLCAATLMAAIGTKPQGLMLAATLSPIVVWRAVREMRERRLTARAVAGVAAFAVVAAVLLGGVFYLTRALHTASGESERRAFVRYDDWANLWQAPWVLVTAPFSPSDDRLYVPWSSEAWFWRRYEIYFSHLGVPFAVCVLLVPWAIAWFRRDEPATARERHAIAAAALGALLLMLPVRDVPMPHGVYTIALPRYVMFLPPVVFALTLAPAVARVSRAHRRYAALFGAVLGAWFIHEALDALLNDTFAPIEYVLVARENPGTRLISFDPLRAASVVDRIAPATDTIHFDAGYAAWIHPAFGRDLKRPVRFLDAPVVPEDARWVVVDREFSTIWQHDSFDDLSQAHRYLARGRPTPRDHALIRQLVRDPQFRAVYLKPGRSQAVFRRVF